MSKPALCRVRAWLHTRREARADRMAGVGVASSLPDLLERLGRRHSPHARRQGVHLDLDVDPALDTALRGAWPELGAALGVLLRHAIDDCDAQVTMAVDVVGDGMLMQCVHFTVAYNTARQLPDDAWSGVGTQVARLGGRLVVETGHGVRAIVELACTLPPRLDVAALRAALGGDQPLRDVVTTLDATLVSDLDRLEPLIASADTPALRQWLHRVSGALGMAAVTDLAGAGVRLEQDMASADITLVLPRLRQFAGDARAVLAILRREAGIDPL